MTDNTPTGADVVFPEPPSEARQFLDTLTNLLDDKLRPMAHSMRVLTNEVSALAAREARLERRVHFPAVVAWAAVVVAVFGTGLLVRSFIPVMPANAAELCRP